MYLVGFITRIFHDARSPERQVRYAIGIILIKKASEISLHRSW